MQAVRVKQKWIHETANPLMPAWGKFCRLMWLLAVLLAVPGQLPGCLAPFCLVLALLLPGSEGCLSPYSIPTRDPELFILLQVLPHPKTSAFARARQGLLLPLLLLSLSHLAFCTLPNLFLWGQRDDFWSMYTYHSFLPSEASILDWREARGGGHRDLGLPVEELQIMAMGERGLVSNA